jgi:hypothetical protein
LLSRPPRWWSREIFDTPLFLKYRAELGGIEPWDFVSNRYGCQAPQHHRQPDPIA